MGQSLPVGASTTSSSLQASDTIAVVVSPPRILDKLELPPLGEADQFLPDQPIPGGVNAYGTQIILSLSDRLVYLYRNGQLQVSYPVAIGKQGWETPLGDFQVQQMIVEPTWENPFTGELIPPGGNNPLGKRWIGFWSDGKDVIGFHGTPNEKLIGQAVSHGCVRMRNEDAIALFEQVEVGTPVTVIR
ncbi:MAG: L,D-transpeptidase [Spirulinaceae cyanobacterium]